MDGKTVRGTRGPDGSGGVHLLAAFSHTDSLVLAQVLVDTKVNETGRSAALLDQLDLAGAVVTADAMHTIRATVTDLLGRGADYVLPIKQNQHRFYAQLDALPWSDTEVHATVDTGHGRREQRTIQVLPLPDDVTFPVAVQAFLVERYVTHTHGKRRERDARGTPTERTAGQTSLRTRSAEAPPTDAPSTSAHEADGPEQVLVIAEQAAQLPQVRRSWLRRRAAARKIPCRFLKSTSASPGRTSRRSPLRAADACIRSW